MLTHGYVGLGFSNNGRMKDSDIVIGWIKEDSIPFLDVSLRFHILTKYALFSSPEDGQFT